MYNSFPIFNASAGKKKERKRVPPNNKTKMTKKERKTPEKK
jgi:hypothetical protein